MGPVGLSAYLQELNTDTTREAGHIYALLSTKDDLIGFGDIVYGKYTSKFPTEDGYKIYTTDDYTHIHMRDWTADVQYNLVTYHSFSSEPEAQTFLV